MTWSDAHRRSEELALAAHQALREGNSDHAHALFAQAGRAEADALALVGDRPRTYGIVAVSATALFYKGRKLAAAEQLAHQAAANPILPVFARDELRSLLQAIWNERAQEESGVDFVPGQVVVSVKGGQVVHGGAPLDLILSKVQNIQSIYYRTAEWLKGMPHRQKGPPTREIQDNFKPWLFQAVPGSYQFIVAVQKPLQPDLFGTSDPEPQLPLKTEEQVLREGAWNGVPAADRIAHLRDIRRSLSRIAGAA